MIAVIIVAYLFVSVGLVRILVELIKRDPELMPGGGTRALVLIAFAWPLILVLAVVGLLVLGVSEL